MADPTDNLVLELLRQMRNDMNDFRTEVRDSLHRVEIRLGVRTGMPSSNRRGTRWLPI
jgi:hypothetical protein